MASYCFRNRLIPSAIQRWISLSTLTVDQLRDKFADVFGEAPRTRHKEWLVKRIAWRMQANAEGDLSERARRRAAELANDVDLRVTAPKAPVAKPITDEPVMSSGNQLQRHYKGRLILVDVLADGFMYDGETYPSLSAVAKAVTGARWSGNRFFGLLQTGGVA